MNFTNITNISSICNGLLILAEVRNSILFNNIIAKNLYNFKIGGTFYLVNSNQMISNYSTYKNISSGSDGGIAYIYAYGNNITFSNNKFLTVNCSRNYFYLSNAN